MDRWSPNPGHHPCYLPWAHAGERPGNYGGRSGGLEAPLNHPICRIPFDQLDFVVGALILVAPWASLTTSDLALLLGLTFVGHVVVNHAAYTLGVRDVKW